MQLDRLSGSDGWQKQSVQQQVVVLSRAAYESKEIYGEDDNYNTQD